MVFMARQTWPTFRGSWGRTSTTRTSSRDLLIAATILGANKIVVNPALPADTVCGLKKCGEQFDKSDFPCIILASSTGEKGI
jgi:hypothetical protein